MRLLGPDNTTESLFTGSYLLSNREASSPREEMVEEEEEDIIMRRPNHGL